MAEEKFPYECAVLTLQRSARGPEMTLQVCFGVQKPSGAIVNGFIVKVAAGSEPVYQ